MKDHNWDILDHMDMTKGWDHFTEFIYKVIDKHIPESRVPHPNGRNCPYLSKKARETVRLKHKRWQKYIHCKTEQNLNLYKRARNNATSEIRTSLYNYEKDMAGKIKSDSKIFWKYVRSKSKTKSTIGRVEKEGGGGCTTTSDEETANVLNDYFATVFTQEPEGPLPEFTVEPEPPLLDNIEITEDHVLKAIAHLNPSKTPGPDNLHPKLLVETKDTIVKPLTKLFKTSIEFNTLPSDWKEAYVTPIFKKGSKKKPENYRPISLTSVPCKILQRIIRDKIVEHMETHSLFNIHQHGFRSKHSCVTQLLEVIEDLMEKIDQGHEIDIAYLDFSKAFDKVPHKRLLHKLKAYNISGTILDWIESFLKDLTQQVIVNGCRSNVRRVTSGVPQGSVLGPVLFLVYVNDMPNEIHNIIKLFADDTKLYSTRNSETPLQTDLNTVVGWTQKWLMTLNTQKCKHMHIGRSEQHNKLVLKDQLDQDIQLIPAENEKDLGVTFDKDLKFGVHIQTSVNKANKTLGIIFRTYTYMDIEMFKTLYKTLVRPHLEYASVIWSPYLKKDKISIENVQRRATKRIRSIIISHMSYPDRLRKIGLPTLEYRRIRADMVQVYKILTGLDQVNIGNHLQLNVGSTRGHPRKLYKHRHRTNLTLNTFSYRVVDVWNNLPEEVVMAPSLNTFKSRLNKVWKNFPSKFEPSFY